MNVYEEGLGKAEMCVQKQGVRAIQTRKGKKMGNRENKN